MVDGKITQAIIEGAPLVVLLLVIVLVVGCTWLCLRRCRPRVRDGYQPIEEDSGSQMESENPISVCALLRV